MNILMLSEVSVCRLSGGASRLLGEQACGLKKLGHRICLLVRGPDNDPAERADYNGIPELRYAVSRESAAAFVISSIFNAWRAFERAAKDHFHPDIVIVHQSLAAFGPLLFARKRARKWVYNCHSLAHEEFLTRNKPPAGPWARFIYNLHARVRFRIEGWVMRRCQFVFVESRFMKDRVMRFHGINDAAVSIVPAGADISRFKPAADKNALRGRLGLPEGRIILFTVRNLVPRMGLENLIKALKEIEKSPHRVFLAIGGKGPLREPLEQMIRALHLEASVVLKGFIPENDLPAWYQCADLVIMPTLELEGFGLVTVEALACGTLVLGTPVGATPEILGPIDKRLVAKGNDARSIAEALAGLLALMKDAPDEWNRLGEKGVQSALNYYTWEKSSNNLEALINPPGGNGPE